MKQRISEFIRKYEMLSEGDRVLIALSGGADSVFLTWILEELRDIWKLELYAVHINHKIRGEEADRDEQFVRDFCAAHEIPLRVFCYPVPELAKQRKQSEEETGREVRKEACTLAAEAFACRRIALAHHETDLAETLLHHLARGTSLPGLASMRPVRGREIRPLLCVTGEEIRRELSQRQIPWCEDSTNAEDLYTRNGIRHQVLPYLKERVNAGSIHHMAETSLDLLEVEEYLAEQTREAVERYVKKTDRGFFLSENLLEEKELIVSRVIRAVVTEAAGGAKDLTRMHIQAVRHLCDSTVSHQVSLPCQLLARRTYEGVLVCRNKEAELPDWKTREMEIVGEGVWIWDDKTVFRTCFTAKKEEKQYTKCFPYDKIKSGLVVRTRRTGDYLVVNREGGTKKLKDFLIDRKIPREDRDSLLLVCSGQEVLWILGDRTGCWTEDKEGHPYLEVTCQIG